MNGQASRFGLRESAPGACTQPALPSREIPNEGMGIDDEVHERRARGGSLISRAVRCSDVSISRRNKRWPCANSSSVPTISTSPFSGRRAMSMLRVLAGTSITSGRPPRPIATARCPAATRRTSSGKRRRASPIGRAFMDIILVQALHPVNGVGDRLSIHVGWN